MHLHSLATLLGRPCLLSMSSKLAECWNSKIADLLVFPQTTIFIGTLIMYEVGLSWQKGNNSYYIMVYGKT